ncbi:MAG: RNA polymerase sigma factor [Pseudomonadota bacterium]
MNRRSVQERVAIEGPKEPDGEENDVVAEHTDVAALFESRVTSLVGSLRKAFGNGPPDPEDIAQLAFQKLLERGERGDIREPTAFLWRTARNLVLKAKRAENVRSRYDYELEHLFFASGANEADPERVLCSKQQLSAVNEALRGMSARQRRCFVLHKVDGRSIAQVARAIGVSKATAHKHVTRAGQIIDAHLAMLERDADE